MAILSNKKSNQISSTHDFDRINDRIYGGKVSRINKNKDVYSSDYVYAYVENDEDFVNDLEVGINKNYQKMHDDYKINDLKNEDFDSPKFSYEEIKDLLFLNDDDIENYFEGDEYE